MALVGQRGEFCKETSPQNQFCLQCTVNSFAKNIRNPHNSYSWQSHQIWAFFTFLVDLAHCVVHGLHELKTHQGVMHYSGRAIMSESHKIGRNWIVYLMERCNIVKVLRYKTENMGIELQILFHSSLLLSNRFMPANISLPNNFTLS